ncbi:MAG: ATP-binding protein [Xanthomonadales bacterium]|nr:ATP-binding protein [Xanthomonadales bacterium]
MRLRNQLLALSLLTLLLPWSGWKLVQELENFLREAEENALLVSARTISHAMPAAFQADLKLARGRILPLRQLDTAPVIDGYLADWPQADQRLVFTSPADNLALDVLAGRYQGHFYLALKVTDPGDVSATSFNTGTSEASRRAGVMLYVQSNRGQHSYMIASEAPGPMTLNSQGGGTRLEGAWMDDAEGYTLEVALPVGVERIAVGAVAPAFTMAGVSSERYAGTLDGRRQGDWLELVSREDEAARWLGGVVPDNSRAWLVQGDGWVVADSGPLETGDDSELTWVQRMIYQAVADSRMQLRQAPALWPVRFEPGTLDSLFTGGASWRRDADSAAVYSLVAVPVRAVKTPGETRSGEIIGAVVMETRSEGMLLMTNRALGRFSLVALALVFILAAGLWLFATLLSRRVQKLSAAVNRAMDDTAHAPELPSATSGDEVGELARNTAKLLKAVSEYTAYLQNLAGRLSHELKTPIAITRSSLENLASRELDAESRQYLERAREGLDRQAAIVAAMSEAQRLEGSVRSTEWETIDLAGMLKHCVAGYRAVHPSRSIGLELHTGDCRIRCAPELIAQALDKLVDNAIGLSGTNDDVTISLRQEDSDCLLSVANTGTRLPDVLHGQLFDSLVSLRDKKAGRSHLGLGLHIVKLVAEAHGGSVDARNLPQGAGVEFTLHLPYRL